MVIEGCKKARRIHLNTSAFWYLQQATCCPHSCLSLIRRRFTFPSSGFCINYHFLDTKHMKIWSLCKVFHNYIETMLENKSWNKDTQTHLYTDSHNDSHSYPTGFIFPNLTNFDLCCLMKVWDLSGQITNDSYMFSIWDWFTKRPLHLDLNFFSLLL